MSELTKSHTMPELTTLKDLLLASNLNDDLKFRIAHFVQPEDWNAAEVSEFMPLLQTTLLTHFHDVLRLPGKDKEESLFLLLEDIGLQLPLSDAAVTQDKTAASYTLVWDYIQRIRANPASVSDEQEILFALMFPSWLSSVLSEKKRQVAYIMTALLQNLRSDPPAQEIDLASQLTQWLFAGQDIHTVFSALWHKGHVQLMLSAMLGQVESVEGELNLASEEDLNRALQSCFIELKHCCQRHALTQNSSIEALLKHSIDDWSLFKHAHVFELLVLSGVDLRHIRVQDGSTLLHIAAFRGHAAVFKRLLAAGIDINLGNPKGETALHMAVSWGCAEVVERLLAAGVDVNCVDAQGKTPLHDAASWGNAAVVERLLAAGVDVHCVDANGRTALDVAAFRGHAEVVERLLAAGVDMHRVDAHGETALHVAAFHGHAEVVEQLLARGIDTKLLNKWGNTAFHIAAEQGHLVVVQCLLKAGVNPNIRTRKSETPLQLAVRHGHTEIVQLLLNYGAHPYVKRTDLKATKKDFSYLNQYYFSWHPVLKIILWIFFALMCVAMFFIMALAAMIIESVVVFASLICNNPWVGPLLAFVLVGELYLLTRIYATKYETLVDHVLKVLDVDFLLDYLYEHYYTPPATASPRPH